MIGSEKFNYGTSCMNCGLSLLFADIDCAEAVGFHVRSASAASVSAGSSSAWRVVCGTNTNAMFF